MTSVPRLFSGTLLWVLASYFIRICFHVNVKKGFLHVPEPFFSAAQAPIFRWKNPW